VTLQQLLLVLRARYKTVLTVLLLTALVTAAVIVFLPRQYTATAVVIADVRSPDPVAGVVPALATPSYIPTQAEIIESERVALKVISLLRLDQHPELRERWVEATRGEGKLDIWLVQWLRRHLDVKPGRESNLIAIRFTAGDPHFAAAVANAFARAYVETDIELKVIPARESAGWFEEQAKASRDRLELAHARISEYQRKNGIVATDERIDSETQRLAELTAQLTLVQAQTTEARMKHQAARRAQSLSDVTDNPLILSLKETIGRLEGKLQEASGNLGPNHPQYQRMSAELASLKERLQAEERVVVSSLATAGSVGSGREAELRRAIAAQKKKLLEIKSQRDELAVLMREGESAQKAYDAVAQRLTQTRLESKLTQTNVAVLAAASEPFNPSAPRPLRYSLIAAVLGLFIACIGAIMREMRNRRIRSADDLEWSLGIPVLAVLDRPKLSVGRLRGRVGDSARRLGLFRRRALT
jgi:succinoglycan biosynthesis transport protein ExoP